MQTKRKELKITVNNNISIKELLTNYAEAYNTLIKAGGCKDIIQSEIIIDDFSLKDEEKTVISVNIVYDA